MGTRQLTINNPEKAGETINGTTKIFGEHSRYKVYACHTRFGHICWMVEDAERIDEETGLLAIIRQGNTMEDVVKGLK